jgi:hypothetical protein
MVELLKTFRRTAAEERRITGRGTLRNLLGALRPLASDFPSTLVFIGSHAATEGLDPATRTCHPVAITLRSRALAAAQ